MHRHYPTMTVCQLAAASLAAITGLNDNVGRYRVRIGGLLIRFAGCPVQFMDVGALAMKDRNSGAAAQQFFADTASALIANILHKQSSFVDDSCVLVE
jgi:hypothetical protein